jgi:uncharacterized glyoxalase superfamily protein PhnB
MYSKLIPILPVSEVRTERDFYVSIGFQLHVDPKETYPEDQFAALAYDEHVLFAVAASDVSEPLTARGLFWQIETTDIEAVFALARKHGIEVVQSPRMQPWRRRTMMLRSPNGYDVGFEEQAQGVA